MTSRPDFLKKAPFIGAFFFAWLFIFAGYAQAKCPEKYQANDYDVTVQLAKVSDGDTIRLTDGRKVRLIAINTPERAHDGRPAQALAEQATRALEAMFAKSKIVHLKFGKQRKDRHGRTLAHVFNAQDQNVAAELIGQGYGFAIIVPPNTAMAKCYFSLEKQARSKHKGIWQHAAYKPIAPGSVKQTGFQYIEGTVTGIGKGRKRIWLDMGKHFAIRIERKHLKYFHTSPENLVGTRIRVRGWVAFYNRKFRLSLKHELMMERQD